MGKGYLFEARQKRFTFNEDNFYFDLVTYNRLLHCYHLAYDERLFKSAGVEPGKVFPHNLRHLFARTYFSLEKDLFRLADLLGHSSVNTTKIYTMESGKKHGKQAGEGHALIPAYFHAYVFSAKCDKILLQKYI